MVLSQKQRIQLEEGYTEVKDLALVLSQKVNALNTFYSRILMKDNEERAKKREKEANK